MGKNGKAPSKKVKAPIADVVVYQNADFVAAVLQEIMNTGLLNEEEARSSVERRNSNTKKRAAGGKGDAKADIPVVASAGGVLEASLQRELSSATEAADALTKRFVYSQSYYLQMLKRVLRERNEIVFVDSSESARSLSGGEFVEFVAEFRPNEADAILDIATPELVAEIAKFLVRQQVREELAGYEDHESLKVAWQRNEWKSESYSEVARAIASAVRADFRSGSTREFYGKIGSGDQEVTAVTICDSVHFVAEDQDRLLDGRFRVLGKVSAGVSVDVPILARNKILKRFNAQVLEDTLRELVDKASSADLGEAFEGIDGALFDVTFAAKINGDSFKVLPIAVYV